MPNQQQFDLLASSGYTHIPLVREILADLETPLSTFLKLSDQPYSYLLESVQGGEKWGRYSIIGLPCQQRLEVRKNTVRVYQESGLLSEHQTTDPLNEVRQFAGKFSVPELPGLPKFNGGLVGYFGYDTVSYIEPHLGANDVADPIDAPDILLMVSHELVVFDNLAGRLFIIVHVDAKSENAFARGQKRLSELVNQLNQGLTKPETPVNHLSVNECDLDCSFPKHDFMSAVEKCKQYIYDGDAFQIVISQRLSIPYQASPLDLYRALRTLNPSPYMYYLNLDSFQIAGSSPEILVRVENGEITLRPIAGTRRRGANEDEDKDLAKDLLSDPKELAEHLMLIDLGRNDVGRVSKTGTVVVTEKMTIEKYSHVMHIVSNVTGEINENLDATDVLKATFPAGTLSGAPKVRAMEIIEELEPDKRGIYSGAIGYLGWNGNMDTAIAIRTALIKDGKVYVQAGAGVVADSVPELEWEETMNKCRAVIRAVEMVNGGLNTPSKKED